MNDPGYLSSVNFPDPRGFWPEGVVAVGGRVDVGTLYHAYRRGIFPWPQEGYPMLWFCPDQRGILDFSDFHIPRRLKQQMKDDGLRFSRNEAFSDVIAGCREQPRPGQNGTWITSEMEEAYCHFHEAGFAHSFEAWRGEKLVGGLYGVMVKGVFSGESMFHRESEASKKVLVYAVETLRSEGHQWIDTQMVTPVIESFGGKMIPKEEYLLRMRARQEKWLESLSK